MFNYLHTIPLCNFGIAFSHSICVIVEYFGKLLLKTIWQPKSSPIFYYPGENRNLKLPSIMDAINVNNILVLLWRTSKT